MFYFNEAYPAVLNETLQAYYNGKKTLIIMTRKSMPGGQPYSAFDGITIDCGTGEIVTVDRFIDDTQEEIGEQIKTVSGAEWLERQIGI